MVVRRRTSLAVSILLTAVMAVVLVPAAAPVAADSGCPAIVAPSQVSGVYEVNTAAKLQWIKDTNTAGALSNNYKLTANINMAGCTWSDGIGAYGSPGTPYTGTFDGNSKTISNLTISGGNTQNLGLFDYLNGSVNDLTLASPSVSGTGMTIGSLAGQLGALGAISGVTATSVSISGYMKSGGLVGRALSGSTLSSVTVSGTVTATYSLLGGVVGEAYGSITSAVSSVNVTGLSTGGQAGGLVGAIYGAGQITNSTSTGDVTSTNGGGVGGAVGEAGGTRPTCPTLTGVVTSGNVAGAQWIGGLVGYGDCYYIYQSSSSASVVGDSSNSLGRAGGIVGFDLKGGRIEKSYFTGQVQGSHYVGGIAGESRSIIKDSYSTGSVTAALSTYGGFTGGLVGLFRNGGDAGEPNAELVNSYASGLVTPPAGSSITTGGLIGQYWSGTITSSVWNKETTGRATSAGTGAKGHTSQELRDHVLYNSDNLNWDITDGVSTGNGVTTGTIWSVCSGANGGYPFLTRQGLSGTCRPTMAYNGNGNTGGTAPSDGSTPYTSGDTVSVVGNTGSLTKTSAVFNGWNTKANGTGTAYSTGDSFTITAPVMLFAQWLVTSSIYYNPNGGAGFVSSTTGLSGSTVTLSSGSGLTRDGYVLSRWDTASAGTGTSYSKGQSITMPAGGLMLYAVWTSTATTTTAPSTTTTTVALAGSDNSGGSGGSPVASVPPGATTLPATATTVASVPTTVKNGTGATATSSPAGGATGSSSTTTTEAASASGDAGEDSAPDVQGVGPGQVGATVNGSPVVATVEESGGSLVVRVGGLKLRYTLTSPDGLRRTVSNASALQVFAGDALQVDFEGFGNDTTAQAWLVPGNTRIGTAVLTNGKGTVRGTVPADASSGERRIVTRAETPMGEPVVVAYGVKVTDTDTGGAPWSRFLLVVVSLAVLSGLLIPAARRRRQNEN